MRFQREEESSSKNKKSEKRAFSLINMLLWGITLFFVVGGLAYLPHLASIFMFLAVLAVVPIRKWQALIRRVLPKGWMRTALAVILFAAAVYTVPAPISESALLDSGISAAEEDGAAPAQPSQAAQDEEVTSSDVDDSPNSLEQTSQTESDAMSSGLPVGKDEANATVPDNSTFEIHFIDVGQADAALVLCDGESMLIDGGNKADSSLIYTYLKNQAVDHLNYIVCTHGHKDHVGGLAGALNYAIADHALCSVTSYDSKAFSDFVKYLDNQNISITVPAAGDTFSVGSASVTVIGPISQSSEPNNTSLVMRIVYGETSFLFTGDAEREEEQEILAAGYALNSTVLKVGHHGSANSTTYPFLREVAPQYAVISVGANNSYGHPTEDTLSRLRDADVTVYRTDLQGDIVCSSDGKTVSFSVERNKDADTLGLAPNSTSSSGTGSSSDTSETGNSAASPDTSTGAGNETSEANTQYVLNTNTKKFHYPSCSSVKSIKDSNRSDYEGSRDDVISMGYSPCGRCNP
jgi:competence protein ComEC